MAMVQPSPASPPPDPSAAGVVAPAYRRGPFRPKVLSPVRERLTGAILAQGFRTADAAVLVLPGVVMLFVAHASALLAAWTGAAAALIWITLALAGCYGFGGRERWFQQLARTLVATASAEAPCLLALAVLEPGALHFGLFSAGAALAGLGAAHLIGWILVRRWRAAGKLTPNVVVVGATEDAARLIRLAMASREVAVLGVFDDRMARTPTDICGVPVLGDTSALLQHKIIPYVDRIVLTVPDAGQARAAELIGRLQALPNELCLFLDGQGSERHAAALTRLADVSLQRISGAKADEQLAFAKRVQDVVLALFALAAATPIMALVALAVRLDSRGPVLFRQRRHGFNNEEITVWKFRSMRTDCADATAARQVDLDDERVTRVGRVIRRTSLDELPQLLNVLKGEMSLVGPRPHAIGMRTAGQDSARLVAEYAWRHRMKPGITGWAQVNGSRGPVHTAAQIRRRVELDIEYIERQSFWFDLSILAMTLPCLLGDRAAVR